MRRLWPGTSARRVGIIVVLAAAWRLWLMGRYYGWEESDYGNLAMVRGVLDGGFRHYDMNHMPGYYALSAAVLALVGDTVVAARAVTLCGGLIAVALAVALAGRLAGRSAAWVAGILLVVQPEFALYSTSSLREPVYAAAVMGVLAALGSERLILAGTLAGAAFLVRFDGALFLFPVLALHALGHGHRGRRLLLAVLPLVLTVALWSCYTWVDHGTPFFWQHAMDVNVETGLGAEATGRLDWIKRGLEVSGTLGAWVMPWRIGWGIWVGLLVALLMTPWTRHGLARTWGLAAIGMIGIWLGIGFVAQHSPDHNLYWKWLCPIVPVILPLGAAGLLRVLSRLPRRLGGVLL
ncbi:MAG: glycosyltransferase family 39 protein, partial [Oligoflexia bacterium]|nr:glycosyltransferase family 39 protein [Oligoflexia bacterium]